MMHDSSSDDDDLSYGDDDSSSSDDDSSSGGVLIWFSLFITHNYELLYYNAIFLVQVDWFCFQYCKAMFFLN